MSRKSLFVSLIFLLTLVLSFNHANKASAEVRVTVPSFPECAQPQGELKVTYLTGVHGIPGDSSTHTGTDTVYNLTEETHTQCYCAENADGIQTNWWKVSSLNVDEIEYLQALGWIYVPDGSAWGLEEAPYMALNSEYSCGGNGGDGTDKKVTIVRNRMGQGGPRGEVLGASTAWGEVLGLAATGNTAELVVIVSTALVVLLISTFFLLKKSDE